MKKKHQPTSQSHLASLSAFTLGNGAFCPRIVIVRPEMFKEINWSPQPCCQMCTWCMLPNSRLGYIRYYFTYTRSKVRLGWVRLDCNITALSHPSAWRHESSAHLATWQWTPINFHLHPGSSLDPARKIFRMGACSHSTKWIDCLIERKRRRIAATLLYNSGRRWGWRNHHAFYIMLAVSPTRCMVCRAGAWRRRCLNNSNSWSVSHESCRQSGHRAVSLLWFLADHIPEVEMDQQKSWTTHCKY